MKRTKTSIKGGGGKPLSRAKAKQPSTGRAAAEVDRRGKVLPPRQRVGGIITPQ